MQKLLPEAGQGGISPPFFKEGNAEFLLQLVNGMAQRGLGDAEPLRGPCIVACFGKLDKISEMNQIHKRGILSIIPP